MCATRCPRCFVARRRARLRRVRIGIAHPPRRSGFSTSQLLGWLLATFSPPPDCKPRCDSGRYSTHADLRRRSRDHMGGDRRVVREWERGRNPADADCVSRSAPGRVLGAFIASVSPEAGGYGNRSHPAAYSRALVVHQPAQLMSALDRQDRDRRIQGQDVLDLGQPGPRTCDVRSDGAHVPKSQPLTARCRLRGSRDAGRKTERDRQDSHPSVVRLGGLRSPTSQAPIQAPAEAHPRPSCISRHLSRAGYGRTKPNRLPMSPAVHWA